MSIVIYISGGGYFYLFIYFFLWMLVIDWVLFIRDVTTGDLQVLKYAFVSLLIFLSCTFPELVLDHESKTHTGHLPLLVLQIPIDADKKRLLMWHALTSLILFHLV